MKEVRACVTQMSEASRRGYSKCKGPGVGLCLARLRNSSYWKCHGLPACQRRHKEKFCAGEGGVFREGLQRKQKCVGRSSEEETAQVPEE